MAELGNFTINITCPDTSDIEAFGEMIGKLVEDKYKEMLEKEAAKDKTYDDYLKELKTIISEAYLGKKVCCGVGVGAENPPRLVSAAYFEVNEPEQNPPPPFTIQSDNYKEASSGWKLGKNGELELNTKTSKVVIEDEVLELFDKNGTLRVRVQL